MGIFPTKCDFLPLYQEIDGLQLPGAKNFN